MATCFLFLEKTDVEQCFSVRFNQEGQVDAPLERRSLDALKGIQQNATTIVVLPTRMTSLHELELPWLGERKARTAIPYALEEQLAQNILGLHFAFDHQHYQHHRYLVVVMDKALLVETMDKLKELGIVYQAMTIDWFALDSGEAFETANDLLVNDDVLKGALSSHLASLYVQKKPETTVLHAFKTKKSFKPSYLWLAQRLVNRPFINLCQAELQQGSRRQHLTYWYRGSAVLFGLWLMSLLLFNVVQIFKLNHKTSSLDQKIATIYHEFFPQSKQVINPGFRMSQWLKTNASAGDSHLWTLLAALTKTVDPKRVTLEELHFKQDVLVVTLTTPDFAVLDDFQHRLEHANIQVKQKQAASQQQHVLATLELRG